MTTRDRLWAGTDTVGGGSADPDRSDSEAAGEDGPGRESPAEPDAARFRHLVAHIQDAVVEFELVDGEPVVRGINEAFTEVFGYDRDGVVGASLNDRIVPGWLSDEAATLDSRTEAGKVNYRNVRRQTADGLREFLYRGVPYERVDGRQFGFAIYTDLTDANRKERRLAVLNRLFRHNLRNRVNVVLGATGQLRDHVDVAGGASGVSPEPDAERADAAPATDAERAVATLEAAADDLLTLAGEVEEINRTLTAPVPEAPSVDGCAVARDAAAGFRNSHPEASIHLDLPPSLTVAATDRLRIALECLIENAIVHNPTQSPRVWIRARPVSGDDWVDLIVADDGPGIPEADRAVVTGEETITQIRHASGLGLWLAKWTVDRFGGDLSFGESDAGGNAVRLRLRRSEPVRDDDGQRGGGEGSRDGEAMAGE